MFAGIELNKALLNKALLNKAQLTRSTVTAARGKQCIARVLLKHTPKDLSYPAPPSNYRKEEGKYNLAHSHDARKTIRMGKEEGCRKSGNMRKRRREKGETRRER